MKNVNGDSKNIKYCFLSLFNEKKRNSLSADALTKRIQSDDSVPLYVYQNSGKLILGRLNFVFSRSRCSDNKLPKSVQVLKIFQL